jgi:hypothetical protein
MWPRGNGVTPRQAGRGPEPAEPWVRGSPPQSARPSRNGTHRGSGSENRNCGLFPSAVFVRGFPGTRAPVGGGTPHLPPHAYGAR